MTPRTPPNRLVRLTNHMTHPFFPVLPQAKLMFYK